MRHVVFVPGIMGSRLRTPKGELVWPPSVLETQTRYGRIDELLREDLAVDGPIREVWCFGVYRPLIETLTAMGFDERGARPTLHMAAYDWRRDLEVLAAGLAQRLAAIAAADDGDIAIVAHSMGGLVARLVLEGPEHRTAGWFGRVRLLATLGTPHMGAPLALARILGLDSTLGVSGADFARFAADRRYPSGYQLLPQRSEYPAWDVAGQGPLAALDIFQPAVARRLGLDTRLLARARWVHDRLAKGKRPDDVRYFQFAGTGHPTATRVNVGTTGLHVTVSADAGDGTVPLWSAAPLAGQKHLVAGNHTDFLAKDAFKAVFWRLFGKSYPVPPMGAAPQLALSLDAAVYGSGQALALQLVPTVPQSRISGAVTVERTDAPDKPWQPFRDPLRLDYDGPATPRLAVIVPAMGRGGFYRIGFDGQPSATAPALCSVTGE